MTSCVACASNETLPASCTEREGTGACAEAQADGVPCPTPSGNCDVCGKALALRTDSLGLLVLDI